MELPVYKVGFTPTTPSVTGHHKLIGILGGVFPRVLHHYKVMVLPDGKARETIVHQHPHPRTGGSVDNLWGHTVGLPEGCGALRAQY